MLSVENPRRIGRLFLNLALLSTASLSAVAADGEGAGEHPRLYFSAGELPELRALRKSGVHAQIWANLTHSADWCQQRSPRTEWIPTLENDPQYENLYDRFYAAMHDLAIVEHLAFASVLSSPSDDPYFESARDWTVATARVWRNEARNPPDASKAYAVLRVMKGLAVAYDLLYPRLSDGERDEIRQAITDVGQAYYDFFQSPAVAGEGYNKHHGSVDAPPLGIMALALLGEYPGADAWLELVIKKHTEYLLPYALTPSGTNEQSSNFWASTLQYRILFFEALRRVTGRDLAAEHPEALPGRIGLAAVAGRHPKDLAYNESHKSVLFGPSYGQLNYWSPVLVYLARAQRRPAFQHLALWDASLGSIQRTRFITPTRQEELLFAFGPYAYLWYDAEVAPAIETNLPYGFAFPEPEVNEAYLRASYDPGGIVVGMKKGGLVVHAGGRPVYVDQLDTADINDPAAPAKELLVADDGQLARIRCVGPESAGIGVQLVTLRRPSSLTISREASKPIAWWFAGDPKTGGNQWTWPDGTQLSVPRGSVDSIDPQGSTDRKTHYGGMQFADPHPFVYPVVTIGPQDGRVEIKVTVPP